MYSFSKLNYHKLIVRYSSYALDFEDFIIVSLTSERIFTHEYLSTIIRNLISTPFCFVPETKFKRFHKIGKHTIIYYIIIRRGSGILRHK
jgi:hypothetical protein